MRGLTISTRYLQVYLQVCQEGHSKAVALQCGISGVVVWP